MMDHAALRYIQIDTGRVGGISSAHRVAQEARARGHVREPHLHDASGPLGIVATLRR